MRAWIACILLALPATAWAQFLPSGVENVSGGSNYTVFLDTFSKTGQSISTMPEATGTVADVVWDGTALQDLKGNAWTMNGTVPQVSGSTASPLFPNGMAASPRQGAGPFSDANYYSLGTGSDALDLPIFSECFAFVYSGPIPVGSAQVLLADGASSSRGYYVDLNDGSTNEGDLVIGLPGGGGTRIATANAIVQGLNVLCVGYDGASGYAKLNLGTTKITAAILSIDSTHIAKLGRYDGTGNASVNVGMYEFWTSTQAPGDALFTAIQARYLGLYADTGQALAYSGASTHTGVIAGKRWTWPSGVPRIGPLTDCGTGYCSEGSVTHYLLNNTAPATQTTPSLTTGSYTVWQEGTGSVTYAVGTATATGLPCTVTSSLSSGDCHFSITVAGTVTATVNTAPTDFDLVNVPGRVTFAAVAGTVVTTSADVLTLAVPPPTIASQSYSASVTAQIEMLNTGSAEALLGSNQNFAPLLEATTQSSNTGIAACSDVSCTAATGTFSGQLSSNRYALQKNGTALTVFAAGVAGSTATTSTQPTNPTVVRIGSHQDGRAMFGAVSRVCLAKTASGCSP